MHEIDVDVASETRRKKNDIAGRRLLAALTLVAGTCFAATAGFVGAQAERPASPAADSQLPERKKTTLELYVTAKEAYEMWRAAPDEVKIIDVRTPEEYALIGHPEAAWNIPYGFITYRRVNGKFEHGASLNPDFVAEVESIAQPTDTLLLTCRSGDRSARAVNLLAAAGFTNAYTITDGVEGDKVEDPASVFFGKRMTNGWKNRGLPWVYSIDPDKILIEEATSKQTAPGQP